eukprot:GAHX01006089.1.p1 GENE.GAHX01006089.1~~GAHX01006089.1.p1  ORF type:complete len:109 (-),score=11.82 GAHX01006089.1:145-471(-)
MQHSRIHERIFTTQNHVKFTPVTSKSFFCQFTHRTGINNFKALDESLGLTPELQNSMYRRALQWHNNKNKNKYLQIEVSLLLTVVELIVESLINKLNICKISTLNMKR